MRNKVKTQGKKAATRKITAKQAEFLELIGCLYLREWVSPTLAELAQAKGVTKSTAAAYVRRLKAKGYLMQTKGKFRAIRPTAFNRA
jgi:DNA-binding MarR family transcriptional regulator